LEAILDIVGRRSFSPVLLIAGLITLAQLISDFPGVPTLMATRWCCSASPCSPILLATLGEMAIDPDTQGIAVLGSAQPARSSAGVMNLV
jgi:hypothetical protein